MHIYDEAHTKKEPEENQKQNGEDELLKKKSKIEQNSN